MTEAVRWRWTGLALVLATVAALSPVVTDVAGVTTACYLGVVVGAAVAACAGAARAPRGEHLLPALVAGGLCLAVLGDVVWFTLDWRGVDTRVSVADVPWFASYVLLCVALWVVISRSRGSAGDRAETDFVTDAVTIVVVSLLVTWSLSIETIVSDDTVPTTVRAVWAAYPVADAILLALVLRVLASRRARGAVDVTLAAGVCLWLAADVVYTYAGADGPAQQVADAGFMLAAVAVASATWRRRDGSTVPRGPWPERHWGVKIAIAIGPLLVPPALDLAADLCGEPERPGQLLVGTAALLALAVVRTAGLIRAETAARTELEAARDAALEASRAKSMFLANVSHEIRTPLTTVLATAEMLEDTPLRAGQADLVGRMQRSGDLLRSLVEDILDFSRIESGQVVLVEQTFDLHALLGDVEDGYAPRAEGAGLAFELDLDPRVPRLVRGDPTRLTQVLTNLLDNALKFTHDGRVRLAAQAVEASQAATGDSAVGPARTEVAFVVEDTGIGIREADQQVVFESFRQVDGSTTRRYGGTGLGLAICRRLATSMGGSLTLRSTFGVGTTVEARIPLLAVSMATATTGRATDVLLDV
ncbi:sensor histidine kinase [Nocardioides dongxiaopingii]|uniref:sensor histidine kinase n=1 Tax=Nocardioides dongxiaopingii TaxID=2576036 RepID=UPI0010C7641C|nr:ATP-binding protein [Nocardioides dongxiaopingii]